MTFLALNIEQCALTQQQSQLEYQEMIATSNYNYVTSQLTQLESDSSIDMDSPQVQALENYQELYDSQKTSIESQLKVINTEIDSYSKAVDTNVKSECKLSVSV